MQRLGVSRTDHLDSLCSALRERIAHGQRNAIAYGHPVRILSVSRSSGIRIRFADGHIERAHPEDVK